MQNETFIKMANSNHQFSKSHRSILTVLTSQSATAGDFSPHAIFAVS